jgi:class 3 adenylate cyclase
MPARATAIHPAAGRFASLRVTDRVLVVVLSSLWLVCLILHIQIAANGLLGASAIFFGDAASKTAYPTVRAIMPGSDAAVDSAGLRLGDELVRVGDQDLKGLSGLRAGIFAFGARQSGVNTPLRYRRDNIVRETVLPVLELPVPWWWPTLFSVSFALVGLLVILRAPQSPTARALFPAFVFFALSWLPFPAEAPWKVIATIAVFGLSMLFAGPLLLRAALLLPESAAPRRAWVFAIPWLFVIMAPVATSAFVGFPFPPHIGLRFHPLLQVSVYAALLIILARNYFRANPIGRRQIRWVLLGFYLALVPALVITSVVAVAPDAFILYTVSGLGLPLIPIAFLIAIVRYNLFDIDRLVSTAASYSVLSIVFLGGVLLVVPRIAQASANAAGIDPLLAQSALSLGLAVAGVPLHRRLRPLIDRKFFPERHAIESNVKLLLAELPGCDSPESLLTRTGDRLSATGGEPFAIFGRTETVFTAVYVRGQGVPPAVDVSAAFIAELLRKNHAVDTAEWRQSAERMKGLEATDVAALDAIGAGVLLPVRGQGDLSALIFLGPKKSGDIYTSNELTLLTAGARELAGELQRFAAAELLEQAHQMQRKMRRYVPGAIAQQLDAGTELEDGQRDVTVLFVDIRGYTSLAEGMVPEDIFSTVNRYTEKVSDIVQAHGGTIVEFNGDGMMTVFGAPVAIAEKEVAAVRTARAIVETLKSAEPAPDAYRPPAIEVGIGIASGEAYVGNVRAVDRLIWTALGNTTNLAARLQSLSRDLHASVVIDDATASRAGSELAGFVARGPTEIRGRSETISIHTLAQAAGTTKLAGSIGALKF